MASSRAIAELELRMRDYIAAQFKRTASSVSGSASKMRKGFFNAGKAARTMGVLLIGASSAAYVLRRAIRGGITASLEFSRAMAEVQTIMYDTSVSMDLVKDRIVAISLATGRAGPEVAKGFYQILSAGITETAQALEVLDAASKLAVGGLATTKEAVDLLTNTVNAFGMEVNDTTITAISDLFFETVRLGKTTIPELSASLGSVMPIAANVGVKLDELNAMLAALTLGGMKSDKAATQLRQAFSKLLHPTEEAAALVKEAGVNISIARIKAEGFLPVLKDIRDAFGEDSKAIRAIFPNIRGLVGMMALVGNQYDDVIRIMGQFDKATGSTQKAFDLMIESTAGKMDRLKQGWATAWREMGDAFLGTVEDMSSEEVTAAINANIEAAKHMGEALRDISDFAQQATFVLLANQAVYTKRAMFGVAEGIKRAELRFDNIQNAAQGAYQGIDQFNTTLPQLIDHFDKLVYAEDSWLEQVKKEGVLVRETGKMRQWRQMEKLADTYGTAEEAARAYIDTVLAMNTTLRIAEVSMLRATRNDAGTLWTDAQREALELAEYQLAQLTTARAMISAERQRIAQEAADETAWVTLTAQIKEAEDALYDVSGIEVALGLAADITAKDLEAAEDAGRQLGEGVASGIDEVATGLAKSLLGALGLDTQDTEVSVSAFLGFGPKEVTQSLIETREAAVREAVKLREDIEKQVADLDVRSLLTPGQVAQISMSVDTSAWEVAQKQLREDLRLDLLAVAELEDGIKLLEFPSIGEDVIDAAAAREALGKFVALVAEAGDRASELQLDAHTRMYMGLEKMAQSFVRRRLKLEESGRKAKAAADKAAFEQEAGEFGAMTDEWLRLWGDVITDRQFMEKHAEELRKTEWRARAERINKEGDLEKDLFKLKEHQAFQELKNSKEFKELSILHQYDRMIRFILYARKRIKVHKDTVDQQVKDTQRALDREERKYRKHAGNIKKVLSKALRGAMEGFTEGITSLVEPTAIDELAEVEKALSIARAQLVLFQALAAKGVFPDLAVDLAADIKNVEDFALANAIAAAQVEQHGVAARDLVGIMGSELVDALGDAGASLQYLASEDIQPAGEALKNFKDHITAARLEVSYLRGIDFIGDTQEDEMNAMIARVEKLTLKTLEAAAAADKVAINWDKTGASFANVRDSFFVGVTSWGEALGTIDERIQDLANTFMEGLHTAIMKFVDSADDASQAWKQFAHSFLLEIASMIIKQMMLNAMLAIGAAMGFNWSSLLGMKEGGVVDGGVGEMHPLAKGGVVRGLGEMHPLASGGVVSGGLGRILPVRGYAAGGPIVNEPHVAVIGEGSMNEAVVPLPDGKSIPVEMNGGGATSVSINIQAVDAKGIDELLFQKQDLLAGLMQRALREDRAFRGSFTGK